MQDQGKISQEITKAAVMDSAQIKEHWRDWATTRTGACATSMCETIKQLEIDALARRLRILKPNLVLEAGCGNGMNCIALAMQFPRIVFYGFDYLPEMIEAAKQNAKEAAKQTAKRPAGTRALHVQFLVGDLFEQANYSDRHDVVISNRLIINFNAIEKQQEAIQILGSKIHYGGHLLLIENSITMRNEQNKLRALLGLPARSVAPFNRFVTEDEIKSHLDSAGLELIEIEDFMSLHDLLLYVLIPKLNGGHVDYEHPLVKIATELSLKTDPNKFGSWGQNRLFVCRKP